MNFRCPVASIPIYLISTSPTVQEPPSSTLQVVLACKVAGKKILKRKITERMIFVIFIDNGLVKDKLDNSARVALYRDVISAAAKRERCLGSGAEDIRRDGDFFFFRHSRARTVQI